MADAKQKSLELAKRFFEVNSENVEKLLTSNSKELTTKELI